MRAIKIFAKNQKTKIRFCKMIYPSQNSPVRRQSTTRKCSVSRFFCLIKCLFRDFLSQSIDTVIFVVQKSPLRNVFLFPLSDKFCLLPYVSKNVKYLHDFNPIPFPALPRVTYCFGRMFFLR